jgi:uncharacterized protein (DUF608 family)
MIAFPLGGIGAGSLGLGGRGQLRDWELFNRPDKGNSPAYAFPAIWAQAGKSKPVARVLESRVLPPYEGQNGLGSGNVPGLTRLASARFTGEFPLARIDFRDARLPVEVSLEAFTPFIPLEADDSGLPVAVLRYKVTNPGAVTARVSIAWSIDNPVAPRTSGGAARQQRDSRTNQFRRSNLLEGLFMTNPDLPTGDPMSGTFVVAAFDTAGGSISYLTGWPRGRWWNSPMLFWDDFSADGELGPEPEQRSSVGALCLSRPVEPGKAAVFAFLLAWHFPNRTPARCGWRAPKGQESALIGNWYTTRFQDAWDAAGYAAKNLLRLEMRTREFAAAIRDSTLPAPVKDAAMSNLSTLVSTTCFRTADGEFHGFEGVNDQSGCCPGNCTHVWNYETATAHLFPSLSRSLRKAAFGYSLDEAGAIHFRQLLPDGIERSGFAAADGQMGQIIKAYLDWALAGDSNWLHAIWPSVRKALEFCWIPGGWDADRDGVMEGVQHNTYDVEFYGPNPQCGIYYLGALRAAEEMSRAVGDAATASECRRLFENGSRWIDQHLFNGEYYIQRIRGFRKDQVAAALRSTMGADDTESPEYQVGEGCLVDQLVGQYLAEVAGLGALVDQTNVRRTLESIYRYNYKRNLFEHDSVQRIFAVNDEAALVICDYGKAPRPRIPFPYYAEVMTGFEYSAATHMLYAGMVGQGVECIRNIRNRYDGEKRNPYDEAECGHHYARAMAAWSGLLALSGFRYHGTRKAVSVFPRSRVIPFRCFWSTSGAWGTFTQAGAQLTLKVTAGSLHLHSAEVLATAGGTHTSVKLNGRECRHEVRRRGTTAMLTFAEEIAVGESGVLVLSA